MKLKQAFDVARGEVIAFVGAGGKTSVMVGLGYELAECGWRVLATTTSTFASDELDLFPCILSCQADAASISRALSEHQFVLLYDKIRQGQVYGPSLEWMPQLLDRVDSDVLLVEADRALGLPFKAPLENEPRIPLETSLVVPVASLSALGKPLNEEHIYNPQPMIEKYGFVANSPVKSPWLAQVLRDEELGLKDVPAGARVIIFLNQTPARGYLRGRARMIARLSLQSERIQAVALGSVRAAEPVHEVQRNVGALVLAAGQALRTSQHKPLLLWGKDKTAVAHITEQFIRSRIDPICVVTGFHAEKVKAAVKPLGVKVAHNRSHRRGGMLSSLQVGLRAMYDQTAALVALGDQPRIQPKVIYKLLSAYARGQGDWLIPNHRQRRGYPILIGRKYWPEILKLPRRASLRDMLYAYQDQIRDVHVDTDSILRDVGALAGCRASLKAQPPS